jgi:uncharacterized membrane protein YtjA (UPF0391 family)
MLRWAFVFLALALAAGLSGFMLVLGAAAAIVKLLFSCFLLIAVVLFIGSLLLRNRIR